jgi:1,4-dihydroxy-2-naphthoate octaprenyltransferase
VLIGLYLMASSGPLLLLIGIGGVLMAIFYTAGPLPLAYIGLGEVAVFIFMGPLMTLGTYYAVTGGRTSTAALLSGLPIAFTVANILHANNMRDYEADKAANKRTLAVRFGMARARQEYALLTAGAYVSALVLVVTGILPWPTLLIFATIFEAIPLVRDVFRTNDPAVLHRIQGRSAQLHFHVGIMLTGGWLIYAFVLQAANVIQTLK